MDCVWALIQCIKAGILGPIDISHLLNVNTINMKFLATFIAIFVLIAVAFAAPQFGGQDGGFIGGGFGAGVGKI